MPCKEMRGRYRSVRIVQYNVIGYKELKKWVGLARLANPALLFLPKTKGGMGLPSLVTLWKKVQISRACQLISSHDPVVRHAATQLTLREEKSSRVKFRPMVAARDALTVDPGMGRKKLSKVAATMIVEDESDDRLSALLSSERQTGALHLVEEEPAAQWASALERLTPSELKFALNACQDSLPHNSNLAIWKGHPSECKLCGERHPSSMYSAVVPLHCSYVGTTSDMIRFSASFSTCLETTYPLVTPSLLTSLTNHPSLSPLTLLVLTLDLILWSGVTLPDTLLSLS